MGTFIATVPITGLAAGQTLAGLDTRPNIGQLIGLGYMATGTQAQCYTLYPNTSALTAIGAAITLNLGTVLNRIEFNFNPTVDRIRVTGSNLRLNPQCQHRGRHRHPAGHCHYRPLQLRLGLSILAKQGPPNTGVLRTVGPTNIVANTTTPNVDLYI